MGPLERASGIGSGVSVRPISGGTVLQSLEDRDGEDDDEFDEDEFDDEAMGEAAEGVVMPKINLDPRLRSQTSFTANEVRVPASLRLCAGILHHILL